MALNTKQQAQVDELLADLKADKVPEAQWPYEVSQLIRSLSVMYNDDSLLDMTREDIAKLVNPTVNQSEDQSDVYFAQGFEMDDPEIVASLQEKLAEESGADVTVFNVYLDPKTETFYGEAKQPISDTHHQIYQFSLSPKHFVYRLKNTDEVTEFADSDQGWNAIVEFAAKSKKKLNCRPGNTQCGGKCQNGKRHCWVDMPPAEAKKARLLAGKAYDSLLSKSRREKKEARGGELAPSTIKKREALKTAKTNYDAANTKAKLADKYYGKIVNDPKDAKALGLKPGESLTVAKVKAIRQERDAAKAELDKYGNAVVRTEKFKAGKPLSDTQMNKPLSQQEINRLGEMNTLPDPKAYATGTNGHYDAVALNQAYARAKEEAPGLTVAEFKAIRSYTRGSYYRDPNTGLVHGYVAPNAAARGLFNDPNSDVARDSVTQARLIHAALGRLPEYSGTVRRDTRLPRSQFEQEYQVGQSIRLNGVTSTTTDLSGSQTKAYGTAGQTGLGVGNESSKAGKFDQISQDLGIRTIPQDDSVQVEYQMTVRSGRQISSLSAAQNESEVALRHGWTGRVNRIETLDNGRVRVYLEEE